IWFRRSSAIASKSSRATAIPRCSRGSLRGPVNTPPSEEVDRHRSRPDHRDDQLEWHETIDNEWLSKVRRRNRESSPGDQANAPDRERESRAKELHAGERHPSTREPWPGRPTRGTDARRKNRRALGSIESKRSDIVRPHAVVGGDDGHQDDDRSGDTRDERRGPQIARAHPVAMQQERDRHGGGDHRDGSEKGWGIHPENRRAIGRPIAKDRSPERELAEPEPKECPSRRCHDQRSPADRTHH